VRVKSNGHGIQIWRPVNGNSFCNVCVREMEMFGFADADKGSMSDLEAKSRLQMYQHIPME